MADHLHELKSQSSSACLCATLSCFLDQRWFLDFVNVNLIGRPVSLFLLKEIRTNSPLFRLDHVRYSHAPRSKVSRILIGWFKTPLLGIHQTLNFFHSLCFKKFEYPTSSSYPLQYILSDQKTARPNPLL